MPIRLAKVLSAPLALTTLLMLAACDQPKTQAAPPAPPVTVAKPVVKEIIEWDEFTGRFDAVGSVEIRARVSGYLDSVHFSDGALVNQGDLLFVIDRRPYQAALTQAESAAVSAKTTFDLAKLEQERAEKLIQNGNVSQQSLDSRRQQTAAARANLAGAQATVDQARLNVGFTEIRAPISGRISRKLVTEGNLIDTSDTLLTTIVSIDPIYFYFDVDERSYLAYVRAARERDPSAEGGIGAQVTLTLPDERGSKRTGKVDFVDNRIDQATGTMRLRAVFENKDLYLVPGLFARIQIPGSPSYQAVLIPDEATAADQDRRIVYVVADGAATARVVRLGPRIDGYRVVRQGLIGDETIVVTGVQRVRPGAKVTPQLTMLPPERAEPGTPRR
jgi:multidrug efflux system membrane fusion protein